MGVSSLFPLYGIVNVGMERNGIGEVSSSTLKEEDHTEHIQIWEGLV